MDGDVDVLLVPPIDAEGSVWRQVAPRLTRTVHPDARVSRPLRCGPAVTNF